MAKRLVTLALTMVVTMVVLPIISWAQTSPFDGQKYVSETTTWLFNNETISDTQTTGITENNSLYYRSKSSGGGFTFVELQTQEVITFSDGCQVTISKIARTSANNSVGMSEIYAGTSGSKTFSGKTSAISNYAFAAFAFNASVPGTCYAYVKPGTSDKMRISFGEGDGTTLIYADGTENTEIQEIKLTSTKAGSFFIHGTSDDKTRDIYAIRFVPTETTINSEKTWTFESLAKDHTFSSITHKGDGLYLRGQSSNNRNITINEINSDKAGTLNAGLGSNPTDETEPWSTSNAIPSFAFKTTCSGKVYVSVSKNSSASTDPTLKISSGSISIKEQKLTTFDKVEVESPVSQAGTFFISGANCDVYSIHFVPETYEKTNPKIENLAAANLIYTGSAQNLVTTPSVDGGTITFSTEQNGTYTDVIPQGTDAGDYSVWYKVTGDETHNDIAATLVGVKIKKATYTVEGTATATAAYGTQVKNIAIGGLTVKNVSGTEVAGYWAFNSEETPAVDDNTAYTATFTPSTEDANYETLTVQITPIITSVSYTVEHYQQNIENDEYTKVAGDTENISTGKVGEQTAGVAKQYEGFTAPETVTQETISADGSTVVKIYYTRNSYTITFDSDGGSDVAAISGKYGSAVTAPADPTKINCVFEGWYNGNEKYTFSTMPAQNLTLTAHWTIAESVGLTKVSTSKTWTFVNVAENTSYSSLTNFNEGLYIRANSSKTISSNTGSLNIQFSDESSKTSYTGALKLSANSSFAPATTLVANDAVTNADAGCLAVTSDIPGTFYVAAKASSNDASKYVQFIFNGIATSVASNKLNATSGDGSYGCKYEYTATEAGTFVIGSTSVGVNVYCIRFEPTPKYELTTSVSPENAGTITKKILGETENATETKFYKGTEIVLTATANTGYDFQKWTDGTNDLTAEEDKSLKVTMDAAKTIVANFTALEYSITYDLAGGSLAEGVTNPATYTIESDAITLSNPIKNGFTFAGWTGTGITEATTTVTIAKGSTGDRTYTATWTENASDTYSITLPATVNGNSITADVSSAAKNATVTLTIATAENYSLSTITANNGDVTLSGSGNTRTFTMPAANVTITATWTIIQTDSQDSNTSETYTVTESGGIEVSQVTSTEGATSITISADKVGDVEVTSIADDAFNSIENKSAIKSVNLSATKITGVEVSRSSGVFSGFPEETVIYMPAGNTAATGQKNVIIDGTCSDFEMKDGKSYSIPKEFTASQATFKRTFTANQKCTVCLPYSFTATGGTFYEFTGIDNNQVQMTAKTDGSKLSANTPYIFMPNPSSESITASNVIISMSDAPKTENTTFNFVGTYESKVWNEAPSGIYGFSAEAGYGATAGQFVRVGSGASIAPFRAYLEYTGDEAGKPSTTRTINNLPEVLDIVWIPASGGTTGINGLDHQTADDAPMYNLSGQRVDKSYKGIVIQNGKKMIKK